MDAAQPIDVEGFARDLSALRAEVDAAIGPKDLAHLHKIERWGRVLTALGYATAWIAPNPISPLLLAQGSTARWAIMAHHVLHRGYDRVTDRPQRLSGARFAKGLRRPLDWLDWMLPEAWRYEHNVLHHVYTGEPEDPDLVEDNTAWLRRSRMPLFAKLLIVAFFAFTWKITYYAPSTFLAYKRRAPASSARGAGSDEARNLSVWNPLTPLGREFYRDCVAPYALGRFALAPLCFLPLGRSAAIAVLVNSLLAEALTNVQSFLLIAPNHAGDDLYRFEGRPRGRGEFWLRQVTGSVNYDTGGDLMDFLHGWLNYQIEHHLFPDLPLLKYQEIQPRVRAVCERHGVPYAQESVLLRARKLVQIMVGRSSMKREKKRSPGETRCPD